MAMCMHDVAPIAIVLPCGESNVYSKIPIGDDNMFDPLSESLGPLPDYLERIDGTIRIAGHRISLYLILDALYEKKELHEIQSLYPTIPRRQILDVMIFNVQNHESLQRYHQKLKEAEEVQIMIQPRSVPSVEEMRKRFREKFGKEPGVMNHVSTNDIG
jgi:uncharacterized protein (DUF433 family)